MDEIEKIVRATVQEVVEETVQETARQAVREAMCEQQQKARKASVIKKVLGGAAAYAAGSIVLTTGATLAMPKIISALSQKIYKTSANRPVFNEWTPEYVTRTETEKKDGNS